MSATSTPTPAETPLLLRSSDLGSGAASTADGSTPEDRLDGVSPSIKRRLYTSHFLSTFNSRAFEFGAVLYLASIFPNTLLPLSVYALSRGASVIVFSSAVGWYIDVGNRLQVVRSSISRSFSPNADWRMHINGYHLIVSRSFSTSGCRSLVRRILGPRDRMGFRACVQKLAAGPSYCVSIC